jgi:hypothetical protein
MLWLDLSMCIVIVGWEVLVEKYRPTRPWFLLARKEVLDLESCKFGVPRCNASSDGGCTHTLSEQRLRTKKRKWRIAKKGQEVVRVVYSLSWTLKLT